MENTLNKLVKQDLQEERIKKKNPHSFLQIHFWKTMIADTTLCLNVLLHLLILKGLHYNNLSNQEKKRVLKGTYAIKYILLYLESLGVQKGLVQFLHFL